MTVAIPSHDRSLTRPVTAFPSLPGSSLLVSALAQFSMSADSQSPCHRPHWHSAAPSGSLRADLAPAMPRPRYRQDPPGLELMQQGHLEVLPLGRCLRAIRKKPSRMKKTCTVRGIGRLRWRERNASPHQHRFHPKGSGRDRSGHRL
jgi:hypothetical protein